MLAHTVIKCKAGAINPAKPVLYGVNLTFLHILHVFDGNFTYILIARTKFSSRRFLLARLLGNYEISKFFLDVHYLKRPKKSQNTFDSKLCMVIGYTSFLSQ